MIYDFSNTFALFKKYLHVLFIPEDFYDFPGCDLKETAIF